MSVTANLNASVSVLTSTDNGSCTPQMNQLVTCVLTLVNTGGSSLMVESLAPQHLRQAYGPIADERYAAIVGQVVPAGGMIVIEWQEGYTNAGPIIAYGIDLILQMSDGTNVTPAVAPGSINLALATVVATNVVTINGVVFTATTHGTGNVGGVGAPLFDIGTSDTNTAVNLAAAVNQIFGANTAVPSTTNVIMLPPVTNAALATSTITITSSLTISVASTYAAGDSIVITGRQTSGAGGNILTYTFIATSDSTQTGGTGAPFFYAGANASAYATNLAAAIVALFGTSTAAASGAVVTLGATLVSGDFGVGANQVYSAPSLTVAAGTNVVSPQPVLYQLTPGTDVAPIN